MLQLDLARRRAPAMLNLVKTVAGENGAPTECYKCGGKHFITSGIGWHCIDCNTYYPSALGFESIKKKLELAYVQRFYRQRGPDGQPKNS